MVSKGNHPQMALIQVSELLYFTQIIRWIDRFRWMDQKDRSMDRQRQID